MAKVLEKFTEYYNEHKTDLTKPYPGIPELLKELESMGLKLAVASNKYRAAVVSLIRHYFPDINWCAVEGRKEGVPTKPDPSIVFEIRPNVRPESRKYYTWVIPESIWRPHAGPAWIHAE